MRPIQIHPFSATLGAALAGLAMLVVSALPPPPFNAGHRVTVDLTPHPRQHVRILEGETYVVPAGRLLTITTLGYANEFGGMSHVVLKINGQAVFSASSGGALSQLELGVTARAGDSVTTEDGDAFTTTVVLGYLGTD